jgi:hypothetical protein
MCLLPLADAPPLIRGFADPAEPDRPCRNLHARAFLLCNPKQSIEIVRIFWFLDFGLKLGQAIA